MAECSHCGRTFLVGGRSIDGRRYCRPACAQAHPIVVEAERVPDAKVWEYVHDWRYGPCPICGRDDQPVDVHASHRVVSLLFVTRWATRRHVLPALRPQEAGGRAAGVGRVRLVGCRGASC